ncbi:MAG: hypothetical protein HUU50_00140 [Candidatus Brocadiae bacterium]|nr:hypothetical protein [Candidatus Brocadiia bacterium]
MKPIHEEQKKIAKELLEKLQSKSGLWESDDTIAMINEAVALLASELKIEFHQKFENYLLSLWEELGEKPAFSVTPWLLAYCPNKIQARLSAKEKFEKKEENSKEEHYSIITGTRIYPLETSKITLHSDRDSFPFQKSTNNLFFLEQPKQWKASSIQFYFKGKIPPNDMPRLSFALVFSPLGYLQNIENLEWQYRTGNSWSTLSDVGIRLTPPEFSEYETEKTYFYWLNSGNVYFFSLPYPTGWKLEEDFYTLRMLLPKTQNISINLKTELSVYLNAFLLKAQDIDYSMNKDDILEAYSRADSIELFPLSSLEGEKKKESNQEFLHRMQGKLKSYRACISEIDIKNLLYEHYASKIEWLQIKPSLSNSGSPKVQIYIMSKKQSTLLEWIEQSHKLAREMNVLLSQYLPYGIDAQVGLPEIIVIPVIESSILPVFSETNLSTEEDVKSWIEKNISYDLLDIHTDTWNLGNVNAFITSRKGPFIKNSPKVLYFFKENESGDNRCHV